MTRFLCIILLLLTLGGTVPAAGAVRLLSGQVTTP